MQVKLLQRARSPNRISSYCKVLSDEWLRVLLQRIRELDRGELRVDEAFVTLLKELEAAGWATVEIVNADGRVKSLRAFIQCPQQMKFVKLFWDSRVQISDATWTIGKLDVNIFPLLSLFPYAGSAAVPIAWFFEIHQRGDKGAMTESLTWLYRTCRAKGIEAATFTMFDKDWSEFNALAAVSKEMLNSPEAAGMYTNVISRLTWRRQCCRPSVHSTILRLQLHQLLPGTLNSLKALCCKNADCANVLT